MTTDPHPTTRLRATRIVTGLLGTGIATAAALAIAPAAGAVPPGPDQLAPNPPLPPVTISIDDVTLPEDTGGTTPFTFTVSLSRPSDETVSARVIPVDGTAKADEDWIAASTDIEFAPGETEIEFVVDVVADDLPEDDEVFAVMVEQLVNVEFGDTEGLGTIVDDDAPDGGEDTDDGPDPQPEPPAEPEPPAADQLVDSPSVHTAGGGARPLAADEVTDLAPTTAPESALETASMAAPDRPAERGLPTVPVLLVLGGLLAGATSGLLLLRRVG